MAALANSRRFERLRRVGWRARLIVASIVDLIIVTGSSEHVPERTDYDLTVR